MHLNSDKSRTTLALTVAGYVARADNRVHPGCYKLVVAHDEKVVAGINTE